MPWRKLNLTPLILKPEPIDPHGYVPEGYGAIGVAMCARAAQ